MKIQENMFDTLDENQIKQDVGEWIQALPEKSLTFSGMLNTCNELSDGVISLCKKSYDKGVFETKEKGKK